MYLDRIFLERSITFYSIKQDLTCSAHSFRLQNCILWIIVLSRLISPQNSSSAPVLRSICISDTCERAEGDCPLILTDLPTRSNWAARPQTFPRGGATVDSSGNGSPAVQHSGDGSTGTHLRTHRFHLQSPMSGHFDSPFFFHRLKSYVINTLTVKLLPVSSIITLGFFLKKGFAESNPVTSLPPDRLPHFTCSSTGCKSCSCTYQGKGIVTMLFLNYKCIE